MSLYFEPDRNPLRNPMLNPFPELDEPQQQETMTNKRYPQLLPIPIGKCLYCLKVGHHNTAACPYAELVPKNTKLHPGCQIVCWICGCHYREGKWGCCGQEKARAILKHCWRCGQWGDHWGTECPHKDQLDKVAQVAVRKIDKDRYRRHLDKNAQVPPSSDLLAG